MGLAIDFFPDTGDLLMAGLPVNIIIGRKVEPFATTTNEVCYEKR